MVLYTDSRLLLHFLVLSKVRAAQLSVRRQLSGGEPSAFLPASCVYPSLSQNIPRQSQFPHIDRGYTWVLNMLNSWTTASPIAIDVPFCQHMVVWRPAAGFF